MTGGFAKALFAANPSTKKLQRVSRKREHRVLLQEEDSVREFLSAGRQHLATIAEESTGEGRRIKTSTKAVDRKRADHVQADNTDYSWMDREPMLPNVSLLEPNRMVVRETPSPAVPLLKRSEIARPLPVCHEQVARTQDGDRVMTTRAKDIVNRMRALTADLKAIESGRLLPIDSHERFVIKHQIRELEKQYRALYEDKLHEGTSTSQEGPSKLTNRGKVTTGIASVVDVSKSKAVGPRTSLQAEIVNVPPHQALQAPMPAIPETKLTQPDDKPQLANPSDLCWLVLDTSQGPTTDDSNPVCLINPLSFDSGRADSPTLGNYGTAVTAKNHIATESQEELGVSAPDDETVACDDGESVLDDEFFQLWTRAVDAPGS